MNQYKNKGSPVTYVGLFWTLTQYWMLDKHGLLVFIFVRVLVTFSRAFLFKKDTNNSALFCKHIVTHDCRNHIKLLHLIRFNKDWGRGVYSPKNALIFTINK